MQINKEECVWYEEGTMMSCLEDQWRYGLLLPIVFRAREKPLEHKQTIQDLFWPNICSYFANYSCQYLRRNWWKPEGLVEFQFFGVKFRRLHSMRSFTLNWHEAGKIPNIKGNRFELVSSFDCFRFENDRLPVNWIFCGNSLNILW